VSEIDCCWSRIGIEGDHSCAELPRVIHCRNCAVFARAARQALDQPAPSDYLAEWAERVVQSDEDQHGAVESCVVFRLAAQHFALPTACFVEAVPPGPVRRLPHRTTATFLGLTAIRGELQLCVSLHALLGLPVDQAPSGRPRVAVVEHEGERWVFPVDELSGVQRIAAHAWQAPPAGASPFVRACLAAPPQSVALLDTDLLAAALLRAVA
jgi:chemotaxis-related protein WspD